MKHTGIGAAERNGGRKRRLPIALRAARRAAHETIGELINHAAASDRRIETLRESQLETNTQIKTLLGALRDLIERIPPENLR